jgi:hypothetical protein
MYCILYAYTVLYVRIYPYILLSDYPFLDVKSLLSSVNSAYESTLAARLLLIIICCLLFTAVFQQKFLQENLHTFLCHNCATSLTSLTIHLVE